VRGRRAGDRPPLLEPFRRDLYLRGIGEFSFAPGVEPREIRVFLDLLNLAPDALRWIEGPPAYLREHGVLGIQVGNALLRQVGLYPPTHARILQAKEALHAELAVFLDAHASLEYRFLGDLLLANDQILPRESLVYRTLLDVCQNERGIGQITFLQGLEARELDALLTAIGQGLGGSLES